MSDETLKYDPFDLDGDGVYWDPQIGDDNSPTAEKRKAKQNAKNMKNQKADEKRTDADKKAKTKAKKAATEIATSTTDIVKYAPIAIAAAIVLYFVTK